MRTSPQCQQDQNRADYMDYLYKLYKRDEAEPGLLSTYTGLYQQHCEKIGKETVDQQIQYFHETRDTVTVYVS
ncbi:MAG TPA: hypothetical protein DEP13_04735 [Gammaproteobacteria bacterium]|nr:hypothetical protein [Gammaproteobacteria bacterium]